MHMNSIYQFQRTYGIMNITVFIISLGNLSYCFISVCRHHSVEIGCVKYDMSVTLREGSIQPNLHHDQIVLDLYRNYLLYSVAV
jgi:hypothetical protein